MQEREASRKPKFAIEMYLYLRKLHILDLILQ
jgi:hypothetical protein